MQPFGDTGGLIGGLVVKIMQKQTYNWRRPK